MKHKTIICIMLTLLICIGIHNNQVLAYQNDTTNYISEIYCGDELILKCSIDELDYNIESLLIQEESTRDSATGKNYTVVITDNNNIQICTYDVYIAYGYTSNRAVISSFTYSRGTVKNGYSVTASKQTIDGNPAKAILTVNVYSSSGIRLITFKYTFLCKVNGNIDKTISYY